MSFDKLDRAEAGHERRWRVLPRPRNCLEGKFNFMNADRLCTGNITNLDAVTINADGSDTPQDLKPPCLNLLPSENANATLLSVAVPITPEEAGIVVAPPQDDNPFRHLREFGRWLLQQTAPQPQVSAPISWAAHVTPFQKLLQTIQIRCLTAIPQMSCSAEEIERRVTRECEHLRETLDHLKTNLIPPPCRHHQRHSDPEFIARLEASAQSLGRVREAERAQLDALSMDFDNRRNPAGQRHTPHPSNQNTTKRVQGRKPGEAQYLIVQALLVLHKIDRPMEIVAQEMSQRKIAKFANVSESTVSNFFTKHADQYSSWCKMPSVLCRELNALKRQFHSKK